MDDASSLSLVVVENLDVARAPQPTLDGVYFIAPSERSVARVVEDCEKKLYRKAHVFFTSAAPRGVLNAIKASKACVSMLGNCSEMNLEYFTVDPKGFSVGVEDALRGTFAVGSEQSQAQARMMDMIAQRLATVMVSLGEIPSIRYMAKVGNKKSDVSRGVADRLDRSLTALLRAKGAEAAKNNPTCDVLIVDRSFDVVRAHLSHRARPSTIHAIDEGAQFAQSAVVRARGQTTVGDAHRELDVKVAQAQNLRAKRLPGGVVLGTARVQDDTLTVRQDVSVRQLRHALEAA